MQANYDAPQTDLQANNQERALSKRAPLRGQQPVEQYLSLIIRIWWQERHSRDENPNWRSEVEDIHSGEKWNFCKFNELEGFLEKFLEQTR